MNLRQRHELMKAGHIPRNRPPVFRRRDWRDWFMKHDADVAMVLAIGIIALMFALYWGAP